MPNDYELLPTNLPAPNGYPPHRPSLGWRLAKLLALRRVKILLGVTCAFLFLVIPYGYYQNRALEDSLHPPLYEKYHARELALPQHNLDLPYPEGRNGKYLYVSSHLDGE